MSVSAKGRRLKYEHIKVITGKLLLRLQLRGHWRGKATVTSLRSLTESNVSETSARRDVEVQTWRCRGTNMILDGWWYQGARIESYMFAEEERTRRRREIHSTYSEFDVDPINQRRTWAILSVRSPTSLWVSLWVDLGDTPWEDPLDTLLNLKFPAAGT